MEGRLTSDVPSDDRIALLIDADNAPASKIEFILSELSTFGVTDVRRAYGNWKKDGLAGWEALLHKHAIRPIQQFDLVKRKNATDIAMVVDALELLYVDRPDAFALVSSDCDFTPLVMHLRAKGATVFGFGERKTPEPFVNACSRFLYLAEAPPVQPETQGEPVRTTTSLRVPPEKLKQDTGLMNLLRNSIDAVADDEGWATLSAISQLIRNQSPQHPSNYGYGSWTKLLKAIDLLELRDEGKSSVSVRKRRK